MRRCARCGEQKEVAEFIRRTNSKRRFNSYCKACQREFSRAHYALYKTRYMGRRHARQAAYRARNREYVLQYIRRHPCVDCGEPDPRVLEFDHVSGEKVMNISTMVHAGVPLARIKEEILKCQVRCANCHRRRTAKQLGWYDIGT